MNVHLAICCRSIGKGRSIGLCIIFLRLIPFFIQTIENDQASSSGGAADQANKHLIAKKTMRDFVGLENVDNSSKDAMIRFSYLSATGNMDEAFKAIKAIKRSVSWGVYSYCNPASPAPLAGVWGNQSYMLLFFVNFCFTSDARHFICFR